MHKRMLIPVPAELTFREGVHILSDHTVIAVPGEWKTRALNLAEQYWDIHPVFHEQTGEGPAVRGEYGFSVDPEKITLSIHSGEELLSAFKTLRQMAEPERGMCTSCRQIIPCAEVADRPGLPFRGIHLCYCEETAEIQLEKMIRLAAACKYNYAVLEFWGTFPYERHPEFQWDSKRGNREFLKRLIRLGQEQGITLIPQINLLGHASGASISTGKHVVLDRHPEYGPLFEPGGWTWCLSNPWVRELQTELMEEVLELFGPVPFFHLGFDEAFNAAVCSECSARPFPELFLDHILFLHDFLKSHQVRMILWHDMFLELDPSRWGDNIIPDRNRANPHEILEKLPRDIVLADWHYNAPEEGRPIRELWPTADHFSSLGFSVLLCPWRDGRGILTMAEKASVCRLDGILQTTWNAVSGSSLFRKYFFCTPNKMWNCDWHPEPGFADEMDAVNRLLRMVVQDMNLTRYEDFGSISRFSLSI